MSEIGTPEPNSTSSTNSTVSPVPPKTSKSKVLLENILSLGLALLIVFMIRSSVIEAFKIPSGSMIPTLLVGDHIFVNKFAYGFKIPFSDLVSHDPYYVVKRDPPKRGDIIVFMFPKDESLHYIKRVVGVPGDTVEVRNKILYVNGKMVPREPLGGDAARTVFNKIDDPRYSASSLDAYQENLDGASHMILLDKSNYQGETPMPVTVPAESLFVMGDNRDFSNDSRFWGFVPYRNVKGRAIFIWLSLWLNFSDGQYSFRPDRIGTVLH